MAPLSWDAVTERYYQHGVDRGAVYIGAAAPVAWNGLISVDEMGGGESDIIFRDGKIVLADGDPSNFSATISAFFFPDEMSACLGIPESADNLYVDNQKPKRFSMSYRSLIGSGNSGDMFGYQVHLVYNCIASIGNRQRKTLTDTPEPMTFDFSIVCTPVKLAGFRPTAHYILDTRSMGPGQMQELEDLLYGKGATAGRMPTVTELYDMMNFGVLMKVHNNGDHTVKVSGASQYFTLQPDGTYVITNMNAVDIGNEFTISDGGNTVIVP